MLDFTPLEQPIRLPAGDSLSITCDIAGIELLTNPVFTGRVSGGGTVFEDFVVAHTATGAVLRLTPAQTRALFDSDETQVIVSPGGGGAWFGRYDLQLSHDPDVARTFMRGSFTVESDVTP